METGSVKSAKMQRSYWDNKGRYQNILNKLTEQLVPIRGAAQTVQGELIRAVNRLYYEYCNNGNINARDEVWGDYFVCYETHEDEDGNEYEEEIYEDYVDSVNVSEYYAKFIELIRAVIPNSEEVVGAVESIIEDLNSNLTYDGDEMQAYIDLTDLVVAFVYRNRNEQLEFPAGYDRS